MLSRQRVTLDLAGRLAARRQARSAPRRRQHAYLALARAILGELPDRYRAARDPSQGVSPARSPLPVAA